MTLHVDLAPVGDRAGLPSVTVVITSYNYGRFLNQCMRSVLSQTGIELRIIIVDDASTDDTSQIAADFAREDSRVRLIKLRRNIGMIAAVNLALQEVNTDYFVKLDADDMLTSGSLQRSVALLEKYPNVGFVYGRPYDFHGDAPPPPHDLLHRRTLGALAEWIVTRGCKPSTVWPGSEWIELRYRRAHNCIEQPEAVIRLATLKRIGQYNSKLPHTSDLEMWLRLASISDVGRVNQHEQGYYRIHPASMQRTVHSGLATDLVGRRDAFLSDALVGTIPRDPDLSSIVKKKLARQAIEAACKTLRQGNSNLNEIHELINFAASTSPTIRLEASWRRLERLLERPSYWQSSLMSMVAFLQYCRHEFFYLRWFRTGV